MTPEHRCADALGLLLLRDTRTGLHASLTGGIDGLDATTYPVLSGLARLGDGVTTTELASAVGLDRSVTSRHVGALVGHGLLRRRPHGDDARAVAVELTAAGRAAVERTRSRLDARLADLLAGLDPAEADRFATVLEGVVAGLRSSRS
ncbi:MarR family winged helix-turn-helix transcriptional regulator [Pseudonocardia sp. ICBG1293]|uniref:MarR family winged helix-turn-helix transcriptional regulator n=1 Tax=Pseudonocardia sp. ICBG1293 TaxID=2844382 RepID=UPI001CCD5B3A|nr:MarR family transcriptional regulator [Pseudonocardia sp. ICBG1293]